MPPCAAASTLHLGHPVIEGILVVDGGAADDPLTSTRNGGLCAHGTAWAAAGDKASPERAVAARARIVRTRCRVPYFGVRIGGLRRSARDSCSTRHVGGVAEVCASAPRAAGNLVDLRHHPREWHGYPDGPARRRWAAMIGAQAEPAGKLADSRSLTTLLGRTGGDRRPDRRHRRRHPPERRVRRLRRHGPARRPQCSSLPGPSRRQSRCPDVRPTGVATRACL